MLNQNVRRSGITRLLLGVVLLLLLISMLPGAPAPSVEAVAAGTVTFEDRFTVVSNTSDRSVFPWAVIDRNNRTHIVWLEETNKRLMYTNNVGSADGNGFAAPVEVEGNVVEEPYLTIAPNGQLILTYARGNAIVYRRGTLNGASVTWTNRGTISSDAKSFGGHAVVDANNTIHVVWLDNRCGTVYNVYYRQVLPNGDLTPTSSVSSDCGTFAANPAIAIDSQGTPQVAFEFGREVNVARLVNGNWVRRDVSESPSLNTTNPFVATDNNCGVYVAFGEGIGPGNHDVIFRPSFDCGVTQASKLGFSTGPEYAQFPHVAYAPLPNRIYVTWQDEAGGATTQEEIWFREFDPVSRESGVADKVSRRAGRSMVPTIATSPRDNNGASPIKPRMDIVWHDRISGSEPFRIYRDGGITTGGQCTGTVQINGGAALTNNPNLSVGITPVGCNPNQMIVSFDRPDDAKAREQYFASFARTAPAPSQCNQTVFVKLFEGERTGDWASDTIKLDTQVNALVQLQNPFMDSHIGDPLTQGGAGDGDPGFTRNGQARLLVQDSGDCSGISAFFLGASEYGANDRPIVSVSGAANTDITLAVGVRDLAGNSTGASPLNASIFYDTTVPTQTAGTLQDGPNPLSANDPATKSVLRTLRFTNVNATDTGYQLKRGKPFWGVWVAVYYLKDANGNPRPAVAADSAELKWYPLEATNPGTNFDVVFSLFTGTNHGTMTNKDGNYQVYARTLDGAGWPTTYVMSQTFTLDPGYVLPTSRIALIAKP